MTASIDKLARLMAIRRAEQVLRKLRGTIDTSCVVSLIGSQDTGDISGGELEEYRKLVSLFDAVDNEDSTLESRLKLFDEFKSSVSREFDIILEVLTERIA